MRTRVVRAIVEVARIALGAWFVVRLALDARREDAP
jgi:hypothetical protein